jgi:DeoR/GlpR family transcriptional regulator of sugar metabolism
MEVQLPKHRLKQKELVMNIFFLFEKEYERSPVESIWEIELPIEGIKRELGEICSVHYRSNLWIYTQLRRYEEDLGVRLFRKDNAGCAKGSFRLSIYDRMLKFYQKQHLYVSDKIKVANGVYDKIINDVMRKKSSAVRIFLGAGSTIFHLANILAEKAWRDPVKYLISTHNLGVLKRLLEPTVDYRKIDVFTPKGQIDPVTYTILGEVDELDSSTPFDYVVMGTSYILDGKLYVESQKEAVIKNGILNRLKGEKILILTKHEFIDQPLPELQLYGSIQDFDYVIVPKHSEEREAKKKYERVFDQYQRLFSAQIIHWNYTILKVLRPR